MKELIIKAYNDSGRDLAKFLTLLKAYTGLTNAGLEKDPRVKAAMSTLNFRS